MRSHRVDLERQHKEKTMGRPINKDLIGYGTGRVAATRHFFTGGSEATTAAHIVSQRSTNKFLVRLDSDQGDSATGEVLTLVNKANGALVAGEFRIDAILEDSTTVQVTKLRNRTIQYEGGTANVANVRWAAGVHPAAGDAGANVDAQ